MTEPAGTKQRRREAVVPPAVAPLSTGPGGDEAEALFKEARRRRRRRWLAAVCGLVLASVAAAVGLEVSGGGTAGPPGKAPSGGAAPTVRAQPGRSTGAGLAALVPPPTEIVGQADHQLAWAAGIKTLSLTGDGGAHWRTVTPPNLAHEYVAERVTTLDAVGRHDLWLVLEDVPGLVPYPRSQDGSDRGEGIDRSTDGGRTWTFSALPGCLQLCGAISLSFVDAEHGFAAVAADQGSPAGRPAMLFATADGGASWQQIATPPDLGGVAVGGPTPVPQLVFTSAEDGWAVSGALEGPDATTSNPGGLLYRTTDGGMTWSVARGLPSGDLSLPTFFGTEEGVVLRDPAPPSKARPTVYVTHDGGATWSPVALPAAAVVTYKGGALLSGRFSAVSATNWFVADQTTLASTSDAGRRWTTRVPSPAFQATSAVFTSDRDGLALGQYVHCTFAATPSRPYPPSCYPILVVTSDGGRHWRDARL